MRLAISAVALGATLTATALARAQPPEAMPTYYPPTTGERPLTGKQLPAPTNALELSVGTGYTQGFGSLRSGVGLPSVVTPGIGVDLGVGYRINPKWAVLWAGQYQELSAERVSAARGFTTSVAAQYHFAPVERVDPWFEFGAGYRFLVEDPSAGPSLLTHGLQLGRARVGIDFRTSEAVAIGPMVGADATMFLFQDAPNVQTNISDPRLSTFVFAGLQGRFDVGGSTSPSTRTVSTR